MSFGRRRIGQEDGHGHKVEPRYAKEKPTTRHNRTLLSHEKARASPRIQIPTRPLLISERSPARHQEAATTEAVCAPIDKIVLNRRRLEFTFIPAI